jgi:probable FeS assembly SUF system protein SufT
MLAVASRDRRLKRVYSVAVGSALQAGAVARSFVPTCARRLGVGSLAGSGATVWPQSAIVFVVMNGNESITLARDVEAAMIPVGSKVTLQKGEQAYLTQSLGGAYTVIVKGNLFRIEGKDADALGLEVAAAPVSAGGPVTQEQLEKEIWNRLRSCYDPEIPVNIVDLGLIYDCHLSALGAASYRVDVKMTLTAPGCGMGPMLAQDVQNRLLGLEGVDDVAVELVWEPPWNQAMMTEAARLQLGLM